MTPKRADAPSGLTGLDATLADIVCWVVYALQQASPDELDPQLAEDLGKLIADAMGRLPMPDRLSFLEHATARAETSKVNDYQQFLIGLAETLGLE